MAQPPEMGGSELGNCRFVGCCNCRMHGDGESLMDRTVFVTLCEGCSEIISMSWALQNK